MATPFSQTLRSLSLYNKLRLMWVILISLLIAGLWSIWFFFGQVRLYEISEKARTELAHAVHPIEADVGGSVVANNMVLGLEVQIGDLLVELDSEKENLRLAESLAHLQSLNNQLVALKSEIQVLKNAIKIGKAAAQAAIEEAHANHRERLVSVELADEELKKTSLLQARGHLSELALLQAKAEAQKQREAANALKLTINRLGKDHAKEESLQRVNLRKSTREKAQLEGEINTIKATIKRLEHEIKKRQITAPVNGRLGEVANARIGSVIPEGFRFGAVVPAGSTKVVAEFSASVVGKIKPGQKARLQLEGFPWTQYGHVTATVTGVASETQNGKVRVDLAIQQNNQSRIPLQHGLVGNVEVEVDHLAPAALILQSIGRISLKPSPSATSSEGTREIR